jgi:hypothetical protein
MRRAFRPLNPLGFSRSIGKSDTTRNTIRVASVSFDSMDTSGPKRKATIRGGFLFSLIYKSQSLASLKKARQIFSVFRTLSSGFGWPLLSPL